MEVAGFLKVNERMVNRMAAAGKIPAFKAGTPWRFKRKGTNRWIDLQHNQTKQRLGD